MKSVTVSKGNVKGGSITLGVTKASVGETVSFTTSPTSGFTYQGATVVCEDGGKMTISWSSNALLFGGTSVPSRGQAITGNSYDITDYERIESGIWCYQYSGATFYHTIALMSNRTDWVHQNAKATTISWSNTSNRMAALLDISSYKGQYYIGTQLLVNGSAYSCYNDYIKLLGKTYSWSNKGL